MKIDLAGKVALVTASTAGIGFAIAKGLAESGAEVILNGRSEQSVNAAIARLQNEVPGAAVAAALAVLCLWVDIRVFGNDIPEVSLTEVVQESVLAVIVLVHLLLARKYAHLRYSNILIGGFFLAMLIRELDGLFDLLSHGSWVWFALLATAGSLLLPLRHLRQTLSQLAEYTRTPYYGMMISGLLAILVFSRLFGMHGLWYAVLDENFARVVKNTVEEGSESFGYMLCLTATLGYACYFRGLARQALSPQR